MKKLVCENLVPHLNFGLKEQNGGTQQIAFAMKWHLSNLARRL